MKKLYGILFAVIILVSTVGTKIWTYANDNEEALVTDEQEVREFVSTYFDLVDKSMAELKIYPELEDFFLSETVDYIAIETSILHCQMQISDLHYSDYQTSLVFNDISRNEPFYTVMVEKNTDMYYECLRGEPSSIYEKHTVVVKRLDNNTLKIISDQYENDVKEVLQLYAKTETDLEQAQNKFLQESERSVREQRIELEALKQEAFSNKDRVIEIENENPENEIQAGFSLHSYDRDAARNYAFEYVLSPNSSYVNFETMGGNCTNFTSQCLRAGGIAFDQTGNYQWYYYSSSNRASAWTVANDFRNYYKNNVGSSSIKGLKATTCTFKDTRLGDLVQNVSNNKASHTMFISAPIYDSWAVYDPWPNKYDVAICQNSTSQSGRLKNVPLSSRPSATREYIHVYGCYY